MEEILLKLLEENEEKLQCEELKNFVSHLKKNDCEKCKSDLSLIVEIAKSEFPMVETVLNLIL